MGTTATSTGTTATSTGTTATSTGTRRSVGIRTPDQRLRVFVSSTLQELAPERAAVRASIEQLRLAPVMFESGARPYPAQDVYRAYLDQSDVFVGIYWQQYGWIGPGMSISGLEDEFRLSSGMPRLLYVKTPAPDIDDGLSRMLAGITDEGGVSYKTFTDAAELRELLLTDLMAILTERFEGADTSGPGYAVPSPVTPLVGREREVAEVVALVDAQDRRLVVLTGAGGIGKTRLALAAMQRSRQHWRDGVAFVDLSPVTSPAGVPQAIAAALGLVVQGREMPLDALVRRLTGRHMLIVLDNFEQVLDAAPLVADLIGRAPRLHVLVTSRVVLRVRGEQEWRVDPLAVIPPGDTPAAVAAQSPAIQLFVERVRDLRPGFELTDENAATVAELCRRLDGLPLALELAASWMRFLGPDQMLQRLDERMDRPGALVDLPDRQKTLLSTIEWSYDLLPEPARTLLTQLSVFAAPFTAEAAEAVCGAENANTMESLSTLLDHSMVSPAQRPDGEPAFRLLDAIRRFAAARLDGSDETLMNLELYLLGVLASASIRHGSQAWAMRRLDSEVLNLEAVVSWTLAGERSPGPILRGLGDVWVWLLVRGHLRQSAQLGGQIQSLTGEGLSESDRMAWAFLRVSALLVRGRFADVIALAEEILPDFRRLEGASRLALTLMRLGISRTYTPGGRAGGDFDEALATLEGTDDPLALGYVMLHYGCLLSADGDLARARQLHQKTLGLARSLGDENQRAEAHWDLAVDELADHDPEAAQPHLAVAARHYRDIDHRDGMARCLGALSALAFQRGDARLAAWLTGATGAARDSIGLTPWPIVTEIERRCTAQVAAALPAAEFEHQLAAGRGHPLEDALAEGLVALEGPAPLAEW